MQKATVLIQVVKMVLIMILVGVTFAIGLHKYFDTTIYDKMFTVRGRQAPPKDIVIIGIDNTTVKQMGMLPWQREVYAKLLTKLSKARVVAFDMLFSEPSRTTADLAFSNGLKEHGRVILGSLLVRDKQQIVLPSQTISGAMGFGYLNTIIDSDYVVRSFEPLTVKNKGLTPSLDLAVTLASKKIDLNSVKVSGGNLKAGNMLIKTNKGKVYFNFWGPSHTFPYYSFYKVLNGEIPEKFFENKIVIIGSDNRDGSRYLTPFIKEYSPETPFLLTKKIPKVELHASAVASLLTNTYSYDCSQLLAFILFASIAVIGFVVRTKVTGYLKVYLVMGITIFYICISYLVWWQLHIRLPISGPIFLLLLMFVSTVFFKNTFKKFTNLNT